ncbi:unnamed protein product [Durusdinium trenchii]|uniref:Uncharacterized protein n=1 Tax=Durusdinium trenchii TaxID=1381693 RepID=A0ABP0K566_9DINO
MAAVVLAGLAISSVGSRRRCTFPAAPRLPQCDKRIILVDMDGTIADFDQRALELLQARTQQSLKQEPSELCHFPLTKQFQEHKETLESIYVEENFFNSFKPIEGAIEALKEMQAHPQLEVFLCTSPIVQSKFCSQEKAEWVRKAFGEDGDSWVRRLIITSDKSC